MKTKEWNSVLNEFYKYLGEPNHRYNSFNLCFSFFQNLKRQKPRYSDLTEQEKELAMLNLAFYLASWGMYRGSSFLLRKDYKVYEPIIKKIWEKKYKNLWGYDFKRIENDEEKKNVVVLIMDLDKEIKKILSEIRQTVKLDTRNKISSVLSTKILLGTVACTPAYDRFFMNGLKKAENGFVQKFTEKSLLRIIDFILENKISIEKIQKELVVKYKNNKVPDMKIVDSYFFVKGH